VNTRNILRLKTEPEMKFYIQKSVLCARSETINRLQYHIAGVCPSHLLSCKIFRRFTKCLTVFEQLYNIPQYHFSLCFYQHVDIFVQSTNHSLNSR